MSKKQKHILFVSSWFPTRTDEFNGDFVQRHAQAVSLMNKVSVLHVSGEKSIDKHEIVIDKYGEKYQEIIVYFPKSRWKIVNFIKKYFAYQIAKKQTDDFDLIHANIIDYQVFWVLVQRLFFQKPYVISEHWTGYYLPISFLRKAFCRLMSNYSEFVLPVSHRLQKAMQKQGVKARFEIVPNVVDTTKFSLKKKKNNSVKKFLHISTLDENHKNISGQLEAIKILKSKGYNFIYEFAGTGETKPILDFIKQHQLDDSIRVQGAISHSEVAKKMQESDAFVLFSNRENQPCVIIESFAVGTPVIATDVGGVSEFFPDDFGVIIPAKNVTALTEAMGKIINDVPFASPETLRAYAQKTFSQKEIARKFDLIYQKIPNKK